MSASSVATSTLVTLNTGKTVPKWMVTAITKDLKAFLDRDGMLVANLVEEAKEPEGDMLLFYYREALSVLKRTEHVPLTTDNFAVVQAVVLAATVGTEWDEIVLIDPLLERP